MKEYAVFIIAFCAIPEVVEVGSDRYNELVSKQFNHLIGSEEQCKTVAKEVELMEAV